MDEAVALATSFQTSLQDTINWLTQAEQTLNMAQPPSLILDTVLFQIDEHKVVNMCNIFFLPLIIELLSEHFTFFWFKASSKVSNKTMH